MKELDQVSKQNLKSASQDQLNKLSIALDALKQSLLGAKNIVIQSYLEDLKESLLRDIEGMKEEVKDAFDRLAKAQEGDDLYKICVTRTNLPKLKKLYNSLSKRVKQAGQTLSFEPSSSISTIGNILEEFERVAKANLKADTEAQLKKLSDSLVAFQSKVDEEIVLK